MSVYSDIKGLIESGNLPKSLAKDLAAFCEEVETCPREEVGVEFDEEGGAPIGRFFLFGDIEEEIAKDACEYIFACMDEGLPEVQIYINSGGGCFASGGAIIQAMAFAKSMGMTVKTFGMGNVQSMALLIFMAGSKDHRFLSEYALVLSHQGSMSVSGKVHEIQCIKRHLEILEEIEDRHFSRHTKMSSAEIKAVLHGPGENYLSVEECVEYGIADAVLHTEL